MPSSKSTQKHAVLPDVDSTFDSPSKKCMLCFALMQSVPPTRSGVISRGVSTSGSTSPAAEGVNEHDNIKVTPICRTVCLIHTRQEEATGKLECYRHIIHTGMACQSGWAIAM